MIGAASPHPKGKMTLEYIGGDDLGLRVVPYRQRRHTSEAKKT
jgi:hypothetical protein